MQTVLQKKLPFDVSKKKPLPAITALEPSEWLITDDAYAGQMNERVRLIENKRHEVLALDRTAYKAADELLDLALAFLPNLPGFTRTKSHVQCPDGRTVDIKITDPLATLGRVFQNDFCIMQKQGDEHVLTGAILCFPASWSLSEKFMHPLTVIHEPVPEYDDNITKRVQRLFDGIKSDRPLWRFNALNYTNPELFQPRTRYNRREIPPAGEGNFFRSERQTLLRLPNTQAVVFGIHTFVLANT